MSYVYVSGERTPIHGIEKVKKGSIHGREKGEERLDSHRALLSHPHGTDGKMKERTEATEVTSAGLCVYVSGEKAPIHGIEKAKKGSIPTELL